MWTHTYTQRDLDRADQANYAIMRAHTVQEAVKIAIPDDPPRTSYEYEMAAQVFMRRILMCQPNYMNSDAPPHTAYKLEGIYPLPLALIGDHARVALLQIALGHTQSGLGFVVGLQETACQFKDDNILMAGAKTGFAVSTLAVSNKSEAQNLWTSATSCLVPLSKRGEPCTENHSSSARSLCINLYTLLQDFASLYITAKDLKGRKFFQIKMQRQADDIDKVTDKRLQMRKWLDETIRCLHHL